MSFKSSWLYRKWNRQIILITYNVNPKTMYFTETLTYARMTEAQARTMGYIKGKKIKDEFRYAIFPIYVRFFPDVEPRIPTTLDMDLKTEVENRETSSTLYDHFKSNAIEKFLKGMTTKANTLTAMDKNKLLMIVALIAGAAFGLYIILR